MYVCRLNELTKEPHSSSWKMCPYCVVELSAITKQPNNDNDDPHAPNKAQAITSKGTTINDTDNLNTNDSELNNGGTSQVNLLPKNTLDNEVHIET